MKKIYVLLSFIMMVLVFGITALNILVYGSVIQWNLSVLPLVLLIPLYLGFKEKKYQKKMIVLFSAYLLVILLLVVIIKPAYTYENAVDNFDEHIPTLRRHVGETSFFYKGGYYIKTMNGSFSFDINTGDIMGVEDDFK